MARHPLERMVGSQRRKVGVLIEKGVVSESEVDGLNQSVGCGVQLTIAAQAAAQVVERDLVVGTQRGQPLVDP